jgi:hypothetical protein
MRYHRILAGITTAVLSLIAVGCAGPAAETGAGLADAAASSSSATALCGTWKGSYWYVAGDHTSMSGSALTLQIGGDSTFTLKWGNRPPSAGTVAIQGNHVILHDASGSQVTLVHSGEKLYGVTRDSMNGRATMLNLDKQEAIPGRFAGPGPGC